jgi:hypothetical protein
MKMQALTPDGQLLVQEVAQRHGVGTDAVMNLLYALVAGGGSMAQFSHPDLGGMGQWSQGGMIMVGDMFNNGLKYRVDALCNDLANVLRANMVFAPFASSQSQSQGSGYQGNNNYQAQASGGGGGIAPGGVSLFVPGTGSGPFSNWWPSDLGSPSSTGGQNNMSYAFFPGQRRLAIKNGGQVTVYDSGDHNIGGFSQQQGGDQSLTFTSQYGLVRVAYLPVIGPNGSGYNPAPPMQQQPQQNYQQDYQQSYQQPGYQPAAFQQPMQQQPGQSSDDVFGRIEQLANLRQKGVLTDEEFAAKKTELLSRI